MKKKKEYLPSLSMNKKILAIETSATVCGVAVWQSAEKNVQIILRESRAHASKIIPLVETVLTQSKLSINDIDAVAVSSGPGSFTGLRIGMSAVKGLCAGSKIPMIKVPTFDASAMEVSARLMDGSKFAVMSKVNSTEYYCAQFEVQKNSYIKMKDITIYSELEAAAVLAEIDYYAAAANWFNSPKYLNLECPSPVFIAQWAIMNGEEICADDIDLVEPDYYKEFVILRKKQ